MDRCALGPVGDEVKGRHLHGFCDASEKVYCCVVYLHTLLTSKARVTPLKRMNISRLELTAAKILAQMKEIVVDALKGEVGFPSINLWTDSMITL